MLSFIKICLKDKTMWEEIEWEERTDMSGKIYKRVKVLGWF